MKLRCISRFALGVCLAVSVGSLRAEAGPVATTPAFVLVASSSVGGDVLSLRPTLVVNPDGSFSAHVDQTEPSFSLVADLNLNADPTVAGSFTLTNLSSITQFFSVSATLATAPIPPPTKVGGFFGDVTYTDANGDSSVTVATNGTDPFYRAQIDGATIVGLGSFNATAFGGPHVFGTISQTAFGTPIPSSPGPGVAISIGVAFPAFSVTPGDSIQVPFEFVVNAAPEPSFASLFAMGTALILLARSCRNLFSRAENLW